MQGDYKGRGIFYYAVSAHALFYSLLSIFTAIATIPLDVLIFTIIVAILSIITNKYRLLPWLIS